MFAQILIALCVVGAYFMALHVAGLIGGIWLQAFVMGTVFAACFRVLILMRSPLCTHEQLLDVLNEQTWKTADEACDSVLKVDGVDAKQDAQSVFKTYIALAHLEEEGSVESRLRLRYAEDVSGKRIPKREYRLTRQGAARLVGVENRSKSNSDPA